MYQTFALGYGYPQTRLFGSCVERFMFLKVISAHESELTSPYLVGFRFCGLVNIVESTRVIKQFCISKKLFLFYLHLNIIFTFMFFQLMVT